MRRSLAIVLVLVACAAFAQKPPPGLEPLPEPPPPPPMPEGSIDEPRVTIPVQKEDKVEPMKQLSGVTDRANFTRITPAAWPASRETDNTDSAPAPITGAPALKAT